MIKKIMAAIFCLHLFPNAYAISLVNYLGDGNQPRLHLELSPDNGFGEQSFSIDYQQIYELPCNNTDSTNWMPWNVKDEKGNYYGTITLNSFCDQEKWSNY